VSDGTATTRPLDYAILNGAYGAATAGVVYLLWRQGREEALSMKELPLLAAATFTLAEVLTHEKIADWLRQPFVIETADHRPDSPRGSGMRRAVGELMTCSRCAGSWSALALVGLRASSPVAGRTVASLLALSGVNDFLQAHFRWLTEKANAAASANG